MSVEPGPSRTVEITEKSKPARRRASGPRTRSGCLTCRNRKKKCDGAYPVCDTCKRLNYHCLREELRALPPRAHAWRNPPRVDEQQSDEPSSEVDGAQLCRTPNASGIPVDENAGQVAPARKEMLRHYIQTFSILLTTNLENNCFLSGQCPSLDSVVCVNINEVFLPMAMDSPTLLNAILAWSASHLSLRDASFKETALQLRGLSLSSLSSFIAPDGVPDPEVALASCLVLCGMESILGDNELWYQHLSGAFELIRSTITNEGSKNMIPVSSNLLATADGRWLLRNFAYHDVIMSVTCQRMPLLIGNYWEDVDEPKADSYFGLASRLIFLISEISVLNANMSELAGCVHTDSVSTSSSMEETPDDHLDVSCPHPHFIKARASVSTRAHVLELQLLQWQCAPSTSSSLVTLAETFRLAALLHLYRTLRIHQPDLRITLEGKISHVVENMIECLETMPSNCLPESGLLFPLFLAGGEAYQIDHIKIIRRRMLDILDYRHFANVRAALDVLDELWRSRSGVQRDLSGTSDWTTILKERGWKLPLT